jgi:hypothetical protein
MGDDDSIVGVLGADIRFEDLAKLEAQENGGNGHNSIDKIPDHNPPRSG